MDNVEDTRLAGSMGVSFAMIRELVPGARDLSEEPGKFPPRRELGLRDRWRPGTVGDKADAPRL